MAALVALAHAHPVFPGDEWTLLELRQWRAGWLDIAITVMYVVGLGGFFGLPYIPIGIVIFAGLRSWSDGLLIAAAGILSPVANMGLKELAARPRPDAALALVEQTGYTFPSSHSAFVASFYGALIYLLSYWDAFPDRPGLRRAIQGALILFILAIGASRVYLGAHWPSDVLGGFLFGGLCLASLVIVRRIIQKKR